MDYIYKRTNSLVTSQNRTANFWLAGCEHTSFLSGVRRPHRYPPQDHYISYSFGVCGQPTVTIIELSSCERY